MREEGCQQGGSGIFSYSSHSQLPPYDGSAQQHKTQLLFTRAHTYSYYKNIAQTMLTIKIVQLKGETTIIGQQLLSAYLRRCKLSLIQNNSYLQMEESLELQEKGLSAPPKLTGQVPDIALHIVNRPPSLQNIHKRVSMRYGMEFLSKVSLYERSYSSIQKQTSIESIPRPHLNKKILKFLEKALKSPEVFTRLIKQFKVLEKEMGLSIRRSRQSLSSSSSEERTEWSDSEDRKAGTMLPGLQTRTQSESVGKQNLSGSLPRIQRMKTSVMSKSNRISLADAIQIKQIDILKEIQPIQSDQSIQTSSFVDIKSRQDLTSNPSEPPSEEELPSLSIELRPQGKKISIMIMEENSGSSSSLFSQQQTMSLSELSLPELALSEELMECYFETSSPYLVNLSLCLLCKLMLKGVIQVNRSNMGWLLGISTVVAYKLYYDQTIEGLMDFFASELQMSQLQLTKLQRWFLQGLNYELAVSSQQYQNMLMELLSH